MKGSAKIELRDAKSGRLVKQIEKHNIVTNGAMNAMKICLASEDSSRELDEYSGSLLKRYFGGILLFGASIDEDVNNTIPSAAVRASYIGHASCFHTITGDSLMGTYVAGESSIGAHNAKLVFSFDTSQANGNINCICLTSAIGGIFGYGVTTLTTSDAQSIVGSFKEYDTKSRFGDYDDDSLVAYKDGKSYCYSPGNNLMEVSDFSVAKNLGLNMGAKKWTRYFDYSIAEEPTKIHFSCGDEIGSNPCIWSLDTDRVVLQSTTKITGREKFIVEFEVIEAGETTSSKITYDYTDMAKDYMQKTGENNLYLFGEADNWGLFKNYAFSLNWSREYLCIVNLSKGTYAVKKLENKALVNVPDFKAFVNILGTIYLQGEYKEDEELKLYYRVNLDTAEVADIPEFSSKDISHLKVHTTLDPDMTPIINSCVYSGYLYPYLATINNVDTLEKNASRTLKITYNLEY